MRTTLMNLHTTDNGLKKPLSQSHLCSSWPLGPAPLEDLAQAVQPIGMLGSAEPDSSQPRV